MKPLLFDPAEVRTTLSVLVAHGGVFELRALDAYLNGSYRSWPSRASGYFDDIEVCITELKRLSAFSGVYITANPVNESLLARRANRLDYVPERNALTSDQHIKRRRWLLIDVDPVRASGISATESEKEAAKKKADEIIDSLTKRGWPPPLIADSGNGYHLLYRIDLPRDDAKLLEKLLAALAAHFDDDVVKLDRTVFNPSRIVRLYGTLAAKGDDIPERPHRLSKIVRQAGPTEVLCEDQLKALIAELTPDESGPAAGGPKDTRSARTSFDVEAFFARHNIEVTEKVDRKDGSIMWLLKQCPFNPDHTATSVAVFQWPDGKLGFNCKHASCSDKHWRDFRKHFEPESNSTDEEQIPVLRRISWEELLKPVDCADIVLENHFLERNQGLIIFGPSGCGKSTAGFQACACWSAGISGLHIGPPRPLRIVILQTEDSQNDLREYCEGILSQECFTAERIALVKENLLVMEPVPGGSPGYLRQLLDDVATRFKPDLISLNPLLAFCAADYTRELGAILYQVIDPVIKKHHIGFLGVHHTTKPIYKDTSGYGAYDYQYLAAGDARIANWPRASIQIDPVATNPVLIACFRITKRWQRLSWLNEKGEPTRERYFKHSHKIWWDDASQEEVDLGRAAEEPKRILEILPLPSEPGIIREEVRVRAKNKFKIGKDKADDWLKIGIHDGVVKRYESRTKGKRKTALFRRAYE